MVWKILGQPRELNMIGLLFRLYMDLFRIKVDGHDRMHWSVRKLMEDKAIDIESLESTVKVTSTSFFLQFIAL